VSTVDYAASGGNPYSEVEVDIRLTKVSTGEFYIQPAFWYGDDAQPKLFKIRAALPAGNWSWQIESCVRNGLNCLSDGWSPTSGSIAVQSNTSSGNPLYDRGFPTQTEVIEGGEVSVTSDLVYPDGTAFVWLADTAWAAPGREYKPPAGTAQVDPP
jgi:hypothetical protein